MPGLWVTHRLLFIVVLLHNKLLHNLVSWTFITPQFLWVRNLGTGCNQSSARAVVTSGLKKDSLPSSFTGCWKDSVPHSLLVWSFPQFFATWTFALGSSLHVTCFPIEWASKRQQVSWKSQWETAFYYFCVHVRSRHSREGSYIWAWKPRSRGHWELSGRLTVTVHIYKVLLLYLYTFCSKRLY